MHRHRIKKLKGLGVGLLLALVGLGSRGIAAEGATQLDPRERALIDRIQEMRKDSGLEVPALDPLLARTAREHAVDAIEGENASPGRDGRERFLKNGGTDLNHRSVVLTGPSLSALLQALGRDETARSRILCPAMTHVGVGVSESGELGLAIHLVERVIFFDRFDLETRIDPVKTRAVTVFGHTRAPRVRAGWGRDQGPDVEHPDHTQVLEPDGQGRFEVRFELRQGPGVYGFVFFAWEGDAYRRTNYFRIRIPDA